MLVIRMRRTGSKKRPHYRVVVTERRSPREGGFIETLGVYNPRTKPAIVKIDRERAAYLVEPTGELLGGRDPGDASR